MAGKPIVDRKSAPEALKQRLRFHPMRIFLYLVLTAISSSFLFLSISYFLTTYGTDFNNFKLPVIFHANTIILLVSGYSTLQIRKAVTADDWKGYLQALLVTIGIGLVFTAFQIWGWMDLQQQGVKFTDIAGTYLYVISGLHIAHLLVGVVLLGWFALRGYDTYNDPVKKLLFESDPFSKMNVELLCTYWHFVDLLWLYLYVFFVLNIYVL